MKKKNRTDEIWCSCSQSSQRKSYLSVRFFFYLHCE